MTGLQNKLIRLSFLFSGIFSWNTFSNPAYPVSPIAQLVNDGIALMKPSGTFQVSSCYKHIIDSSRSEIAITESAPRALNLRIWYPTDINDPSKKMEYMIDADQYMEAYGPDMISLMKGVHTNASQNEKVSDLKAKYPLLIFSPGFSANHTLYTMLSEDLASHGYIVAVIDHPYLNSTILNGHFINPTNGYWHASPVAPGRTQTKDEYRAHLETALKYLGQDVQFVMDLLTAWNKNDPGRIFTGKIDLDKIAVAGHSAGYLPALGALLNDSRVKTMISYDVALDEGNPEIPEEINKDLLIFRLEYAAETGEEFLNNIGGSAYDVFIKNASHLSIMDFPYIESYSNEENSNPGNAADIMKLIQKLTVSFLNQQFFKAYEQFTDVLDSEKSHVVVIVY
jgi:hypothetical protein